MKRISLGGLLMGLCLGCASIPRPAALDQSKALSQNANLRSARELAPQAFAHAEQVRIRAERAHSDGRNEEADVLARQALVAYDRAATFARRVEAEQQLEQAERAARARSAEVQRVAALQAKVAAETQVLERSLELERSAEPRHPIEPEGGNRAIARTEAARSITEAARLLCVAARLIAPQDEHTRTPLEQVEALLTQLPTLAPHTALEKALDARVSCLAALTAARSGTIPPAQEPDALLSKLSASMTDLRPHQDDRGIVLTDYGIWNGNQLTPHGADVVGRIASVANANTYPILVVLHGALKSGSQSPNEEVITKALSDKSLNARVALVNATLPSLLNLPPSKDRTRTEFILVTSR